MGTGVSMDGQAQGHTVGHARQDEASSKMLTQHQLSTIRGEGALGPAPMASPTPPPLHFTAHPATAPLLPLSQLGTNSSSTPLGGENFSPKPPLPHRMAAQEPSEDRALWAAPAPRPKRRRPFVLLSEGAGSELSELSSQVEINVITDTSQRGLWMRI